MVLVPRFYTRVEVIFYTNHPLLKALLIILSKRSLIKSRQCNGKQKKRNSVKMQPRKVKIKCLVGALFSKQFGGPGEGSPAPPPPLSRWAWFHIHVSKITSIITSTGTTKAKIVPFSTDTQQLQKMTVTEVNTHTQKKQHK